MSLLTAAAASFGDEQDVGGVMVSAAEVREDGLVTRRRRTCTALWVATTP